MLVKLGYFKGNYVFFFFFFVVEKFGENIKELVIYRFDFSRRIVEFVRSIRRKLQKNQSNFQSIKEPRARNHQ